MSADTRALALELACRVGPITGAGSTGEFLSAARMFDKYLITGVTRYGRDSNRVQVDDRGVHVIVDVADGSGLSAEQAQAVVAGALSRALLA